MEREYLLNIIAEDDSNATCEENCPSRKIKKAKKNDISKDEKKKVFIDIMEKYHEGKRIADYFTIVIKEVLNIDEEKKLPNIIIRKEIVKEEHQELYENAIKEYNRSMQMTLDAKAELLSHLDNFIYYVIEKRFATFKKYAKDLYQEGVIGVLKGIDFYDATVSLPTTYFYIYILHEMTEYINTVINKTTSHYSASIVKVKKAINTFERAGKEWAITDLAQETGISAETILQSIRIMEYAKEQHYESVSYLDSQLSQNVASPETEYLKNEANDILYQAVNALPKEEILIIIFKYVDGLSYKSIAAKSGIPIDKVKKKHNAAIRKLRRSKLIHNNFNQSEPDGSVNVKKLQEIPMSIGESIRSQLLAEDN